LLGVVPFVALKNRQGHYLLESHRVGYTFAARGLANTEPSAQPRKYPLVIGGLNFGVATGGRSRFEPLPGTAKEAARVSDVLPGAEVLRGNEVTKQRLMGIEAPAVLHLATHGYYTPDPRDDLSLVVDQISGAPTPSPLLRSGLALSGANTTPGRTLSGLEICGLDLCGTALVVLSACVSSIGDATGDSVYGLPRAFMVAGVDTVVASQFPVPDAATCELMVRFYREWRGESGSSEALRSAQLALLGSRTMSQPQNWASFAHIGRNQEPVL
jgi:CHAT domain-containing protein